MNHRIRVCSVDLEVTVRLNGSVTSAALWEALPLETRAHRWGDEIYCSTPVEVEEDDTAREVVEVGEVAYWPPGRALCLFFGPTPISRQDEIRAASPVNPIGCLEGDPGRLRALKEGDQIWVERLLDAKEQT